MERWKFSEGRLLESTNEGHERIRKSRELLTALLLLLSFIYACTINIPSLRDFRSEEGGVAMKEG